MPLANALGGKPSHFTVPYGFVQVVAGRVDSHFLARSAKRQQSLHSSRRMDPSELIARVCDASLAPEALQAALDAFRRIAPSITVTKLVDDLQPFLCSEEDAVRNLALACLLAFFSTDVSLNEAAVSRLIEFFAARLDDIFCVRQVLLCLTVLFERFGSLVPDPVAAAFTADFFKQVACPTLAQAQRFAVFQLVVAMAAQQFVAWDELVVGFIASIEGERDPRNLKLIFSLVPKLQIPDSLVEDLFDILSCYFPISFRPPPNDKIGISPSELVALLDDALLSQRGFTHLLLELVLEKFSTATADAARILKKLALARPGDVQPAIVEFWPVIRTCLVTCSQPADLAGVLSCAQVLASIGTSIAGLVQICLSELRMPTSGRDAQTIERHGQLLCCLCTGSSASTEEALRLVIPSFCLSLTADTPSPEASEVVLRVLIDMLESLLKLEASRVAQAAACLSRYADPIVDAARHLFRHPSLGSLAVCLAGCLGQFPQEHFAASLLDNILTDLLSLGTSSSSLCSASSSLSAAVGVLPSSPTPSALHVDEGVPGSMAMTDIAGTPVSLGISSQSSEDAALQARVSLSLIARVHSDRVVARLRFDDDAYLEAIRLIFNAAAATTTEEGDAVRLMLQMRLLEESALSDYACRILLDMASSLPQRAPVAPVAALAVSRIIECRFMPRRPLLQILGRYVSYMPEDGQLEILRGLIASLESPEKRLLVAPDILVGALATVLGSMVFSASVEAFLLDKPPGAGIPDVLMRHMRTSTGDVMLATENYAALGLASVVNKSSLERIDRFLPPAAVSGLSNCALSWIIRGLAMRSHPQAIPMAMELMSPDRLSVHTPMLLALVVRDSDFLLNKDSHCRSTLLYKQRFFTELLPVLLELPTREIGLRCIAQMCPHLPVATLLAERQRILPIMLSPDAQQQDSSISPTISEAGLKTIAMFVRNGAVEEQDVERVVDAALLAMAYHHHMQTRLAGLDIADSLIRRWSAASAAKFRQRLHGGLLSLLDDKKRLVRQRAADCRNRLCLLAKEESAGAVGSSR